MRKIRDPKLPFDQQHFAAPPSTSHESGPAKPSVPNPAAAPGSIVPPRPNSLSDSPIPSRITAKKPVATNYLFNPNFATYKSIQ